MDKIIEILNNDNAVKIALNNPGAIFGFINDWTGEKYEKLYKFNKNTFKFYEI